jgi:hypothetical protein
VRREPIGNTRADLRASLAATARVLDANVARIAALESALIHQICRTHEFSEGCSACASARAIIEEREKT